MTAPGEGDARAREVEHLRAVFRSLQQPARLAESRGSRGRNAAAGAVAAGLLFALGKAKFLGVLASVLKLKTLATMLLSIRYRVDVYAVGPKGVPYR